MLQINSLTLKNTGVVGDLVFPFKPGVSVIYGLNKTNASKGSNSNGAGKSYTFSMLKEILFEDPVIGIKQDAVKEGLRILDLTLGDKHVVVSRNNNKLDIEVRKGKKVFRTKGKAPAKQWLAKNLPLTQADFDTYVHLDSRVSHPIVMGTSKDRKDFFNSFFGLDKLDIEKKLFIAEYAKIKEAKIKYSAVKEDYLELKARIGELDVESKRQAYRETRKKLDVLLEKNQKLQVLSQLIAFETQMSSYLKQLKAVCPDDKITEDWFNEALKTAKWNIKHNTEGLKDAIAWERYQKDNTAYIEAYADLSKHSVSMLTRLGIKEAVMKCKSEVKTLREAEDDLAALRLKLKRLKPKLVKPIKPEEDLPDESEGELRSQIKVIKHKLEHAQKFNKGVCDTCGQDVKTVKPSILKERIAKLETKLSIVEAYSDYKEERAAYKNNLEIYERDKTNYDAINATIIQLSKYRKIYEELRGLPVKPAKFEGKKYEVRVKQRMVDEDKERLSLLNLLQPSLVVILELESLSDKQREAAKKGLGLQSRINELQERASNLHGELEAHKILVEQKDKLLSKLRDLKAELVNEESLRLLIEAYSDKAIKKMAIQAISDRLMTVINRYAKVVFPEDFTFEFNWDTSQLAFLVIRKHGKKVKVSDVRKLSGAESKLFTLVLVLALMTFVPSRKRCNVLILDEPTATMGADNLQRFQDLLPVINKVIPSIVILTPKSEEMYENAMSYTVVKTKGVAQICEGHPSEQR